MISCLFWIVFLGYKLQNGLAGSEVMTQDNLLIQN